MAFSGVVFPCCHAFEYSMQGNSSLVVIEMAPVGAAFLIVLLCMRFIFFTSSFSKNRAYEEVP